VRTEVRGEQLDDVAPSDLTAVHAREEAEDAVVVGVAEEALRRRSPRSFRLATTRG
jgi:hypothetical protein